VVAAGGYRIIDEPAPSALSRYIANPFLIMIVAMVAPPFLAQAIPFPQLPILAWFTFNNFALGSPTRAGELAWIIAGVGLVLGIDELLQRIVALGLVERPTILAAIPYIAILHSAALLAIFYRLFLYQNGPYHLHRYLRPGAG
jgi:hypothetical protein